MEDNKEQEYLTYKNYPLVRNGKTIYYGNSYDPFIVMMQIASTRSENGVDVADRIIVQLLNTDPTVRPRERIANKTEKKGLFAAMDIAYTWLQRANN